jgi:hypothetical protein
MVVIFVERNSKTQPKNALVTPPLKFRNDCKHLREHALIRVRGVRDITLLHTISHFLQFYNFKASLNHRANTCSCFKKEANTLHIP